MLCCLRRRRKRRQDAAVLAATTGGYGSAEKATTSRNAGGDTRGNYAALGAGAGGAAAAAAGRRGSQNSDEWEEDQLTGGGGQSGFFVVGGRRLDPNRPGSIASRRSRASYGAANVAPSAFNNGSKTGAFAGLAAAGAGFLGAAFGRGKKNRSRVEIEEEQPLSDDDLGDGSMAERRGLMPFTHDSPTNSGYGSPGDASRSVSGPAAALLGAAAGSSRNRNGSLGSPQRSQYMFGLGGAAMSRPGSDALSGSGSGSGATASSHTQRAGTLGGLISSSNSTGGFTTSGSGGSLPPPPRAPRGSPTTYGNLAPSHSNSPATSPHFSAGTTDSSSTASGLNPALLGAGAAAGGLAALAAGHRESDGSSYSRHNPGRSADVRGSHISEMSAEELGHLRRTDPERYSRFISTGTNLLGPNYQPSPESDEGQELGVSSTDGTATGAGGAAFPRTRLSTIRSVGEFGEKSDSSIQAGGSTGNRSASSQPFSSMHGLGAAGGSLDATSGSGSRHLNSPLPMYEAQQQAQAGEGLPLYTARRPSEGDVFRTPMTEAPARFITPPDSPQNIAGGTTDAQPADAHHYDDANDTNKAADLGEAGLASGGILGGVAAGWRRLTMGQLAWSPEHAQRASSNRDSSVELDRSEGRTSYDPASHAQRPSEDSSRLIHTRHGSRIETSETGLAPEVASQRASVYGPSALGHSNPSRSSKEASGSSGERAAGASLSSVPEAARQRSYPSLSSGRSSARGGLAHSHSGSSLSGRPGTGSSGLDSLSARAQLSSRSTGSGSTRSGFRSGSSRGGRSGGYSEVSLGSTGAASYSPSGVLSRGDTTSTQDRSRRSGEMSDAAEAGSSVDRRKRPRSSSGDGLSRLDSLSEDPFGNAQPPAGGHYPSESLGAAVSRSVARDLRQEQSEPGSFSQSQPLPRGLQPSTAAPAPTTLAPSLSTPSLDAEDTEPRTASASWRPSPRVTSAAQRAAEAQAALLRAQQGGPTPPRSMAASPSGGSQQAGASYNWADLETTFRGPEPDLETNTAGDTSATFQQHREEEEADRSNSSIGWPKFLRF